MNVRLVHEFKFESAHMLPKVPPGHKCARMHGHSFKVELSVEGPVDPETGWFIDFGVLYDLLERQRLWRNIINGVAVLLLLTVIFLLNRHQLKQKNRYQRELNRQQVELFNAIAATQEQERKRIAQDIHDSLGSVLSAAKLKLTEVRELRPEFGTDDKFITGINLLDEASAELRNISHNIMPATLSKLGLVPALKNLSEKISTHKGLQVSFSAHEFESRLEEQTEISIYRIILELINNIVKHDSASHATVQLVKYPDNINMAPASTRTVASLKPSSAPKTRS